MITLLAGPAALGTLLLMRLLGSRGARVAALLLMAVFQAIVFRNPPTAGFRMMLVFVLIPLLYGVLLSLTWLLGADLLDAAPRFVLARLYSTMGAASLVGGLLGAMFGKSFARRLEPEWFLMLGAALLVAAAVVCVWAQFSFPVESHRENPGAMPVPNAGAIPLPHQLLALLRHRYALLMAAVGWVGSIAGVLIEFQFYESAARAGGSEQDLLNLFANFYVALNLAAVSLQILATPPLQRRLGVHGSLMILPTALAAAAVVTVATSAAVLGRAALRVAEGGLKSSIHRSNWEQAYLPIDRSRRAEVKLLVDGVASRVGEGTAAVLLLLPGAAGAGSWIGVVLIAAAVAWLALAAALRRSRQGPGLIPDWEKELRPDLPIPDGCITVGTLGEGVQRDTLSVAEVRS
jgi:AAA family ATP:ADP antiporter